MIAPPPLSDFLPAVDSQPLRAFSFLDPWFHAEDHPFFLTESVSQLGPKVMGRIEDPLELPLAREPAQPAIPIELIRRQRSAGAAFSLACQASSLDDKEIYLPLGIDAGTFSRIKKGEATIQGDKLAAFCAAVGNTIYLEWMAYQVGCTLVMIETEAQRLLRLERARADKAEERAAIFLEALNGRSA